MSGKKRKASALVSAVEFLEDMSLDSGLPLGPSKVRKSTTAAIMVDKQPSAKRRRTGSGSSSSSSGSGSGSGSAAETKETKTTDGGGDRYARLEALQEQLNQFPEARWMTTASRDLYDFIKFNRSEMNELETAVAAYRQEPSAVFVHGDETWLFPRILARFRLTPENEDLALVGSLSVEEEPGLVSTTGYTPGYVHGERLDKINALRDMARAAFASVPSQRLDSAKTLLGEPLVEFGMTQPAVLAALIALLKSPYNVALRVYVNICFAPLASKLAAASPKDAERMKQGAKASPSLRIPLSLDTWRNYKSDKVKKGPLSWVPIKKSLDRILAAEAVRKQ